MLSEHLLSRLRGTPVLSTSPINTTSSSTSKRSTTPSSTLMSSALVGSLPFPLFQPCPRFQLVSCSPPYPSFFVLVFRFLRRTRNSTHGHGAKRQRPLSSRRYVFIGVLPAFYVSLGAMPFTCQGAGESIRDASCSTEPKPARPQGSPKARLHRFGGVRS